MSRATDFLEAHQSPNPSRWRENAQWRRDNEYWLKYSRHITLNVLRAMEEIPITQKELASRMGCTQQYVSNLLRGSSNMTLETIARLENALNIDLIKLVDIRDPSYSTSSKSHYLNDSLGEESAPETKTSNLVDGYKG